MRPAQEYALVSTLPLGQLELERWSLQVARLAAEARNRLAFIEAAMYLCKDYSEKRNWSQSEVTVQQEL